MSGVGEKGGTGGSAVLNKAIKERVGERRDRKRENAMCASSIRGMRCDQS